MADLAGSNGERQVFNVVGKRNVPGRLSYSIATGMAKFGTDVIVPDMLHAKFLRSPFGRAKIKSVDISQAKALQGVVDIVTWDDPDILAMPELPVPLLIDEADMEDEEVGVVVVAETEEICNQALNLLDVKWEALPHVLDPREGMKPDAPILRPNPQGKGNMSTTNYNQGDVEAGFREADHIVEFDWDLILFCSHLPNPNGGVSWWYKDPLRGDGESLFVEGICPNWGAKQLRAMYSVNFDKLYRNTMFQGGKYCDWGIRRAALITPLLAKRTGRPVRCVNIRQNDYDIASPQRYMHVKVGFKDDGTVTAVEDTHIADVGVRGSSFFMAMDVGLNPYYTTKCLNLKSVCHSVYTNTGRMYTSGQMTPFNWDGLTIAEQRIAEKLGMDPVEVALKNIHGPASQTDKSVPRSFQMCIDKGREAMNWKWHAPATKKLPDGRMHGGSFRYQMSPRHATMTYACTVTVQGDGKVYVPTKGPWAGIYSADAVAMVVAEEMGARVEDVILEYDRKAIFTPVGGGSDGTAASSWVAKEAAVACKKSLLKVAAETFRVEPEELDTKDSTVYLKSDPGKNYPFSAFPEAHDHDKDICATYYGRPPTTTWNIGRGKILETMNASFCEVAVDTETGKAEVTKYVVVCDPGKALRPTSLEGQIHQVMMFTDGIGLTEEFIFDKKTGVKLNTNMFEYKKPTILDIGPCDPYIMETRTGNACYGSSGISHAMASTQLIVCAVQNAIGEWITPPVTPDKVLKALGKV
jgi:CO/xanthine dehydrogenase Mo-binding subunit